MGLGGSPAWLRLRSSCGSRGALTCVQCDCEGQSQGSCLPQSCPCTVGVIVMSGPCSPSGRAWAWCCSQVLLWGRENTGLEKQHLCDGLRQRALVGQGRMESLGLCRIILSQLKLRPQCCAHGPGRALPRAGNPAAAAWLEGGIPKSHRVCLPTAALKWDMRLDYPTHLGL